MTGGGASSAFAYHPVTVVCRQVAITTSDLSDRRPVPAKPRPPVENLTAIEHSVARLEVLPFADKAAAHYGQLRAELERAGTPCGSHDMQIGGHARSEGLILVTNNTREFARMPGIRTENWV